MKRFARYTPIAAVILAAVSLFIWLGYSWDWTGFFAYIDSTNVYHPAKTLWDWMSLLGGILIPLLLAFLGRQQARIADDRKREETLQNYFDKMTELLLENKLRTSAPGSEVQDIARARTVTTLRQLDEERRNMLLRFLLQAGLISKKEPTRPLSGVILINKDAPIRLLSEADLREAVLHGAYLREADLRGTYLSGADLSDADLREADLRGADLREADLREACLREADLDRAALNRADLSGADLDGANLSEADLDRAALRDADLREAVLNGANLSEARLNEAVLYKADLREAILSYADLRGARLSEAYLSKAVLYDADLREACLREADLNGTFLRGANLRDADLREADLREADLREAELFGAKYNYYTSWPDGFDPEAAGAIELME